MKARLFGRRYVEIGPRSTRVGGSFRRRLWRSAAAWDAELLELVYHELKSAGPTTLLDIGANTGSFTLLAALLPELHVWAFEPAPLIFPLLVENIRLNAIENRVQAQQVALSAHEGKVTLKVPSSGRESGLASLGTPLRFDAYEEHEVTARTLDSLQLGEISFIKIDTEGCELNVLRGAVETIRRCRPKMVMEFNQTNLAQFGHVPDDLLSLLNEMEYDVRQIGREDLYAQPRDIESREK